MELMEMVIKVVVVKKVNRIENMTVVCPYLSLNLP